MPNFSYVKAKSLKEAISHLSSKGARIHAGGTDLLGCLRDDIFEAEKLVSIGQLKALRGISQTSDGGLRIGALTTIAEIENNKTLRERYSALAQAASEVGSPQLRNQGTIGGNICQKPRCWYYRGEFHCLRKGGDTCYAYQGENQFHCIFGGDGCYIVHPSDTAPALVAFEAMVRVSGPGGSRLVPIAKFHVPPGENVQKETILKPNEIVTEILLPPRRREGCAVPIEKCAPVDPGTLPWQVWPWYCNSTATRLPGHVSCLAVQRPFPGVPKKLKRRLPAGAWMLRP